MSVFCQFQIFFCNLFNLSAFFILFCSFLHISAVFLVLSANVSCSSPAPVNRVETKPFRQESFALYLAVRPVLRGVLNGAGSVELKWVSGVWEESNRWPKVLNVR